MFIFLLYLTTTFAQNLTFKDVSRISISPLFCRLDKTKQVLGWAPSLNTYVYQNKCNGFCLSFFPKLNECRPIYRYLKVSDKPYSQNTKYVRQIVDCDCSPKRCLVNNRYYNHNANVINECNQKCKCQYGRLVNCCRQRKSFNDMSFIEQQRYINTYKLATNVMPYKTQYNNLVQQHQLLFGSGIHNNHQFLPWHRWFILQLENILQDIDCRVTLPYWNWVKQANNPFVGEPWTLIGNSVDGNNCVNNGPFAYPGWTGPDNTCLKRNINVGATFATTLDIQQMYTDFPTNYNGMRMRLEFGPGMHGAVHCAISGTMCTSRAADAPEFFLHHCNIDFIWNNWQNLSPGNMNAYSGPNVPMPGTSNTPYDLLNLLDQPNNVKVCYIKSRRWTWLESLTLDLSISKIAVSPNEDNWLNSIGLSEAEINAVRSEERKRNRGNIIERNTLLLSDGIERDLGFIVNVQNVSLQAVGCLGEDEVADMC